jgi:hypothetical protein
MNAAKSCLKQNSANENFWPDFSKHNHVDFVSEMPLGIMVKVNIMVARRIKVFAGNVVEANAYFDPVEGSPRPNLSPGRQVKLSPHHF